MENENATTKRPTRNWWATASLVFGVVAWVLFGIAFLTPSLYGVFCCAHLCWPISLVSGIIALVDIRKGRPAYRGKPEAILGVCLSGAVIVLYGTFFFLLYCALRGEPFDESDPASVVATIGKNCGFEFPEKMESLKAADRLAGGIDNPYFFVVSFMTDQSGFAQLRDSLSQLGNWKEITDELSQKDYDTDDYDPRDWSCIEDAPQWYKMKIAKGRTYEGFLVSKNNRMRLFTFCVDLAEPNRIAVYMEGWGDPDLKKDQN